MFLFSGYNKNMAVAIPCEIFLCRFAFRLLVEHAILCVCVQSPAGKLKLEDLVESN